MTITVTEALDSDTSILVTVRRTAKGQYVDGIYQEGSESTFPAMASPQPAPNEVLQILPEADRTADVRAFYINKKVYTDREERSTISDDIYFEGDWYRVISVGKWQPFGYNLAVGVRVK